MCVVLSAAKGSKTSLEMGKFFADSSQLEYNWNQVAIAFWLKYPNPHRSVFTYSSAGQAHLDYIIQLFL